MSENIKPPRWAEKLLRNFSNPATREEVEGDLQEFFRIWTKEYGIRKARWKYIRTVLTLLRPMSINKRSNGHRSFSNSCFMIQSYLIMSWRTLLKNKVSSLINISGLTLGITTSILILLIVLDEFGYDKFHSNLDNIYVLMKNIKTNDGISTGNSTPGPMAEALRTEFPEVKYAAREVGFDHQQVVVNDKISYESGIYADPDFFKIMSFNTVEGNVVGALESNSAIVITRDMARKLFADENPLGKPIVFNRHTTLTVGAIIENIPDKSSVKFGIALPFALFEKENDWLKKWDDNRIATWMLLHPSSKISALNDKLTHVLQERSNEKNESLFAYPLKDLYLRGSFSNGIPDGGKITAVQMIIAFGVFMLLLACINFMNISTAQSEHRAKEVGVRKVMGASRKWIVFQFLNESFIITFLALFCSLALTLLVIPGFNTLVHAGIRLDLTSPTIWLSILGIGLATALLAGSYPSLYLSKFSPVRVMKGSVSNLKGIGLRRVLVTFQFSISIFFLISTIIMYSQFEYVRNRPIGYDQENLINIRLDSTLSAKFAYLKTEVLKFSNVTSATGGSTNILYSGGSVTGMDWPGKRPGEDLSVAVADVEYDWSKTMGIKILEGRDFDPEFPSDSSGCILNESAVAKMGLQDPIGSIVGGRPVIGVFQNFVYNNPSGAIAPMSLSLNPKQMNHLYLRVRNDSDWRKTINHIEKLTKAVSPEFPFSFSFTKDEYQHRFNEIADTSLMISILGGMTIFISCLGLFGLSGFIAEKRSKEMSIRKVFGAGMLRVLVSLSRDFLKPVLIALFLVIPLCILAAQTTLSNFSYHIPLTWWMFASGGIMILVIAFIIVIYHGLRTAHENPITRLRNE